MRAVIITLCILIALSCLFLYPTEVESKQDKAITALEVQRRIAAANGQLAEFEESYDKLLYEYTY